MKTIKSSSNSKRNERRRKMERLAELRQKSHNGRKKHYTTLELEKEKKWKSRRRKN